jgi:hypothetical protein
MAVLKVATCQFAVGADIEVNLRHLKRQMTVAAQRGARVAHFPEGALSGYAGVDFESFAGFDWDSLGDATVKVSEHARDLAIWTVVGSAHRLSGSHKPHNSLYVIDDAGQIVERYDKRFCGGDTEETTGDLAHYTPGDHFSVWNIDGVRCGALICYDYRFPELYRQYKTLGVDLVFHSFHAGHASPERIAEVGMANRPCSAQPELSSDPHLPGHHHARGDDRRGRLQPRLDQLSQLLSTAKLLAGVLHPRRRHHRRTTPPQRRRGPGLDRRHGMSALRFDRRLA